MTLKYGEETQPVIAKDVQFHPVTDAPVHFDLYRVDEHQLIRIEVPVHFRNHEASPGIKRGGTLNVDLHELELMAPADQIPEELVVDLTGLDIGDTVRAADIALPQRRGADRPSPRRHCGLDRHLVGDAVARRPKRPRAEASARAGLTPARRA